MKHLLIYIIALVVAAACGAGGIWLLVAMVCLDFWLWEPTKPVYDDGPITETQREALRQHWRASRK